MKILAALLLLDQCECIYFIRGCIMPCEINGESTIKSTIGICKSPRVSVFPDSIGRCVDAKYFQVSRRNTSRFSPRLFNAQDTGNGDFDVRNTSYAL